MKNLLTLLLALGFIFSIAACEPRQEAAEVETETEEVIEDTEAEIDTAATEMEQEIEEEDTTSVE